MKTTSHPLTNYLILLGFLLLIAGAVIYVRFVAIPRANNNINHHSDHNNYQKITLVLSLSNSVKYNS